MEEIDVRVGPDTPKSFIYYMIAAIALLLIVGFILSKILGLGVSKW